MQGHIKSYLDSKKYGFIKGDDNKDYFFHISDISFNSGEVKEGLFVSFDENLTKKGLRANRIEILDDKEIFGDNGVLYRTPSFVTSKNDKLKDWSIIQKSNWIVKGSSPGNPNDAKRFLEENAREIGANGVINVTYHKTTGSKRSNRGKGHGTYHYTIHNFSGIAVFAGNKDKNGTLKESDIPDLNLGAELAKKELSEKRLAIYLSKVLLTLIAIYSCLFAINPYGGPGLLSDLRFEYIFAGVFIFFISSLFSAPYMCYYKK